MYGYNTKAFGTVLHCMRMEGQNHGKYKGVQGFIEALYEQCGDSISEATMRGYERGDVMPRCNIVFAWVAITCNDFAKGMIRLRNAAEYGDIDMKPYVSSMSGGRTNVKRMRM